jgi:hypothetical protein
MGRVFGKGRFANVTATLALFVALGGTGYAAISIPSNSVGSAQIKPGGVATSDIKANAVTSGKVKDGTLKANDFASGQLLVGPAGPAGVAGAKGDKGDKGDAGTPAPPEAFHVVGGVGEPAFAAPFANFGGGTATAAFYKDAFGLVHLKGLVTGVSLGAPIFTLPAGYRPAESSYFPTMTCAGYGDALVNPDGTVRQRTAGSGVCYSLDGITFRAA